MRQHIRNIMTAAALFLLSLGAWAGGEVTIVALLDGTPDASAGTITAQVQESNGQCTLTVTPAAGNYIEVEDIAVVKTIGGDAAQARALTPALAEPIGVEQGDAENTYVFQMPGTDYDVEVTANFHASLGIQIGNQYLKVSGEPYTIGNGTAIYDAGSNTLTLRNVYIEGEEFGIRSSVGSLTVHLVGHNMLQTNGYAIQSTVEANVSNLTFTTDEQEPGQLIMACTDETFNFARDMFPMFKANYANGLKRYEETQGSEMAGSYIIGIPPLVCRQPVFTVPNDGCCFTTQPIALAVKTDSEKLDIYYSYWDNNLNERIGPVKYTEPFTLAAGKYFITAYTVKKGDDAHANMRSDDAYQSVLVYDKPSFTPAPGYYDAEQQVAIESTDIVADSDYPQLWYYTDGQANDSVRYLPGTTIAVGQSTTIAAYILDNDSGRVVKTDTVMATYRMAAPTNVWVQAASGALKAVTEDNAADVLGDGRVSYDSSTNTLTLKGATLAGIVSRRTDLLTISLQGVNSVNDRIALEQNTSGSLHFTATEGAMLEMKAKTSVVSGFSNVTLDEGLALLTPGKARYEKGDYRYDFDGSLVGSATIVATKAYQLWVAGTQVTAVNQADVLADGHVSYDDDTNTLTLNGAHIAASQNEQQRGGIESAIFEKPLNIDFYARNSIDATATPAIYSPVSSENIEVNFMGSKKDEALLTLATGCDQLFENVADEITYTNAQPTSLTATSATIAATVSYDLWVGNTQVTSLNRQNILGDAKTSVSFNGRETMILNDATLADLPIKSGMKELTIILLGCSRISSTVAAQAPIQATGEGQTLTWRTSPDNYGQLNIVKAGEGSFVTGFESEQLGDGLVAQVAADDDRLLTIWRFVPITPILNENDEGAGEKAPEATVAFTDKAFTTEEGGVTVSIDLSNTTIGNLLYTLADIVDEGEAKESGHYEMATTDGEGQVQEPAGIVLTVSQTEEEVEAAVEEMPGSDEYAEKFKGITFMAPAGIGTIRITAKTETGAKLCVKLGKDNPRTFPNDTHPVVDYDHEITIPYESAEPLFVMVYHGGEGDQASRSKVFREKVTTAHVKVTGIKATTSSLVQVNSPMASSAVAASAQATQAKVYELTENNYVNDDGHTTGIVISTVCGVPVTALSSSLFENVGNKDEIDFIDLSGSAIQGFYSSAASRQKRARRRAPANGGDDRLNGVLNGFDAHTLVFLPAGNEGGTDFNVVVGDVCNSLELLDGKVFNTPHDFRTHSVRFDRLFTAGQTATIFLPCTIPAAQAAKLGAFHKFDHIDGAKAVFTEAEKGDIPANTPFIFVPAADGELPTLKNAPVAKLPGEGQMSVENGNMVGTFKRIDWTEEMGYCYGFAALPEGENVAAGQFVRFASGAYVPPYRAYLKANANASARLQMVVDDGLGDEATGISEVDARKDAKLNGRNAIYNLSGQRVAQPTKGTIYIINGRKEVMK